MKLLFVAAALVAGCVKTGANQPQSQPSEGKVSYLCVGMETSKRFGSCPGCGLDMRRISSLIRSYYGYEGESLISERATKSEVVKRFKAGVERTPDDGLFLFFYSGHGGQEYLGGEEPDGSDRKDEYLCLYDTYMMDDEIWDIVSKCRGRLFLFFDACHSATMYRSVAHDLSKSVGVKRSNRVATALALNENIFVESNGFTFRPEKFVQATPLESTTNSSPRILCWSGCKESEYSYGGSNGGLLTFAVVNSWKKGISYDDLWESAVKLVNGSDKTQNPVQTYVGAFPAGLEAFR